MPTFSNKQKIKCGRVCVRGPERVQQIALVSADSFRFLLPSWELWDISDWWKRDRHHRFGLKLLGFRRPSSSIHRALDQCAEATSSLCCTSPVSWNQQSEFSHTEKQTNILNLFIHNHHNVYKENRFSLFFTSLQAPKMYFTFFGLLT